MDRPTRFIPTPRKHEISGRAAEIARVANSPVVGPEHVFLAILHDGKSLPALVLGRHVGLDRVEAAVTERMGQPGYVPPAHRYHKGLPTMRWSGVKTAAARNDSHIGVEHVFLDIIRDHDTLPAQALGALADLDRVDADVVDAMNASPQVPADAVFLTEGQTLDRASLQEILGSLPDDARFGFNYTADGRQWVHVSGPGSDTRAVLNAALARLGREPLPADGAQG
jgi:ATP-dependent Clp protease ATP-binding subunit ClpA